MPEAKNIMHIGKVVLQDECLHYIETLQENDNEGIDSRTRTMLEAIMFLTILREGLGTGKKDRFEYVIESLAHMSEEFEQLKA